MGQFTPNIGLYIPSAGETNYNDAFAQGMINLDLHDHTGGPNKGLPITSTGLADFSVTYNKLASDVADVLTGIGVDSTPGNQNRLQILGILRNLFTLSTSMANVGFLSMNGSAINGRTFQNTSSITWSNADGTGGDPSAVVNTGAIFPVTVPNGGTGLTSDTPYALFAGGTTGTSNLQQVGSLGNANDVLTSQGPGALPVWQSSFVQPTKPCFSGLVNAALLAVTGDGTFYRVNFQAEQFDQASNFLPGAAGSSGFTAPYTAIYLLNYYFLVRLNSSSINQLVVQTFVNGASVNNTIYLDPGELIISPTNFVAVSASIMWKLNAGDLVYPVLEAAGSGSKTLDIGAGSLFQGVILC